MGTQRGEGNYPAWLHLPAEHPRLGHGQRLGNLKRQRACFVSAETNAVLAQPPLLPPHQSVAAIEASNRLPLLPSESILGGASCPRWERSLSPTGCSRLVAEENFLNHSQIFNPSLFFFFSLLHIYLMSNRLPRVTSNHLYHIPA